MMKRSSGSLWFIFLLTANVASSFAQDSVKDRERASFLRGQGIGHYQVRQFDQAIEVFKQAIKLKPDYAEAHNDLAIAYSALGRHREAIDSLQRAVHFQPGFAEAWCSLGSEY